MHTRVVGVDVGSVPRGRFAWAAVDTPARTLVAQGADPESAVRALAEGLKADGRAALVLEAPMAVPVPATDRDDEWRQLGRARAGDGDRAWSATPGACALTTGVAQAAWLLGRLANTVPGVSATARPDRWTRPDGPRLLLAEAMVTGDGKPVPTAAGPHAADAEAAARALADRLPDLVSDVHCAPHRAFNLIVAAALWAGLDIPAEELRSEVVVVRARPDSGRAAP
jgi:hypothetical protein